MAKNTKTTTLTQALKVSRNGNRGVARVDYDEKKWFKGSPITSKQYTKYKEFEQGKINTYLAEVKDVISQKGLESLNAKIGTPDGDFDFSFKKDTLIYNQETGEERRGAQLRVTRIIEQNPYRESIDNILDMFK